MNTRSRKALSPVVASIILIAVTVAVSIAVAAWMGALTFQFTATEQLQITNMDFGGAGFPRTCFAADKTGHVLQTTIYEQTRKNGVQIYEEWFATSLVVEDNVCKGLIALQILSGEIHAVEAKAVILATGGAGQVYSKTTNSLTTTGDG